MSTLTFIDYDDYDDDVDDDDKISRKNLYFTFSFNFLHKNSDEDKIDCNM